MTTDAPRWIAYEPLDDLEGADVNPKNHDASIGTSLRRFGYVESITADERTGRLVSGHGRVDDLRAKRDAGEDPPDGVVVDADGRWLVGVQHGWASANDGEAAAYVLASNQTSIAGGWNQADLDAAAAELRALDVDLTGIGFDSEDLIHVGAYDRLPPSPPDPAAAAVSLAERFLVPPFSVLDARQGYWQDRKRAWLGLGIQSEMGRTARAFNIGLDATADNGWSRDDEKGSGTSVFDPVICEIACRWFCPPTGHILDPFAGGSVRGIVAAWLGRDYTGIDLGAAQIDANEQQANDLLGARHGTAKWIHGDAASLGETIRPDTADLLFSCPPYFDLEVYSDDPGDLSNAPDYSAFLTAYSHIIRRAASYLADDRFAVWIVGEIRDKHGAIRGLVSDTIGAFAAAGMTLQSDAVLITAIGSLALRAAGTFGAARRLARGHQYVLVFCKGDPRKATAACGPVEIADVASMFGEVLAEGTTDVSEPACPDRA